MRNRNSERGQALIYVAAFCLVLVAGIFAVFDVGRIVTARIQFQTAADAAALSAVAVKSTKHHVDAVVRAAMTQEAYSAQLAVMQAAVILLEEVLNKPPMAVPVNPGQPGAPPPPPPNPLSPGQASLYRQHANRAYRHTIRLHREFEALHHFYKFLEVNGDRAAREAARIAFQVNIKGFEAPINNRILDGTQPAEMLEAYPKWRSTIGGFAYPGEAAGLLDYTGNQPRGNFGASLIEVNPIVSATSEGASLLGYTQDVPLRANAAARPKTVSENVRIGDGWLVMQWYSPRLMSIWGAQSTSREILH